MNDYLNIDTSITRSAPLPGVDDPRLSHIQDIQTKVQTFGVNEKVLNNSPEEPTFNALLLEWANRQPYAPLGFIDVAAGIGKEARVLGMNGFRCIAQDPSPDMIAKNQHRITKIGKAEKLDYPDNSFSGILNKSAWIFLSPGQRKEFLQEAQRTLISKGSIFLQSERADIHRAHYMPKGSEIPQCLPSFDFQKYGDSCYEEWLLEVAHLEKEHDVFNIHYSCLPQDVLELANQTGLKKANIIEYGFNHPLALENRWIRQSGFIIELQKP